MRVALFKKRVSNLVKRTILKINAVTTVATPFVSNLVKRTILKIPITGNVPFG